jgi:hypothetical protein
MDGNQMFRYPMDIQEMGCATWVHVPNRAVEVTGFCDDELGGGNTGIFSMSISICDKK